jgi:hypothetical protein
MRSASLILIMFAFAGAGCATTVVPPRDVRDPVTVYLTDYGRHSSLLMPVDETMLIEYAFGDFDFFALEHWRWWDMLRVAMYSKRSTLGRRVVAMQPDAASLRDELGLVNAQPIIVERQRVQELERKLDERFTARLDTQVFGQTTELWFVQDPRHYSVSKNCNAQTADWLRELGCEIHGGALTSNFKVRPARRPQLRSPLPPGEG